MTALSVNLNKVALVRNTRHLGIPSVTKAASLCLLAGAQGITVHPRPDGRHIRPEDVADLHHLLRDWPNREFNIEGNPFHNLMDFVRRHRPHQATFVPDGEGQFTSMALARAWGADRVELYTEPYARSYGHPRQAEVLAQYARAAASAQAQGLGVNAGHDLNRQNLPDFLQMVPLVLEVSIGHALISDALETGYAAAVRAYLDACAKATP